MRVAITTAIGTNTKKTANPTASFRRRSSRAHEAPVRAHDHERVRREHHDREQRADDAQDDELAP
ncbi:MAG: hypothetical protein ACREPM_05330 [Gemmatimonadaceae bacterium]